jgi:acetyl esterase
LDHAGFELPVLYVCPLLLTIRPGRTLKFGIMLRISLPPHEPIVRAFAVLTLLLVFRSSAEPQAPLQPEVRIYKRIGTTTLKAYIFMPAGPINATPRAAIVLLHGGGWSTGSPEWMHDDAKRYAGLGMVAIAGEYRLSDQKSITPIEAMADVRDLIRWVRTNAADLSVNPHRIAAYGVSAGGHLALSAAVFPHTEEDRTSAVPDLLVLISPSVSLLNDKWPQLLLGTRTEAKTISPAENVTQRLPPIAIIEGAADTVTPPLAARRFCDRAKQLGGSCELNLYPKLGHILSRRLDPRAQEEGPFDPDPDAVLDAHAKDESFLRRGGFLR